MNVNCLLRGVVTMVGRRTWKLVTRMPSVTTHLDHTDALVIKGTMEMDTHAKVTDLLLLFYRNQRSNNYIGYNQQSSPRWALPGCGYVQVKSQKGLYIITTVCGALNHYELRYLSYKQWRAGYAVVFCCDIIQKPCIYQGIPENGLLYRALQSTFIWGVHSWFFF